MFGRLITFLDQVSTIGPWGHGILTLERIRENEVERI